MAWFLHSFNDSDETSVVHYGPSNRRKFQESHPLVSRARHHIQPPITFNHLIAAELIPYKLSSCRINRINHLCLAQAPCDFSGCLDLLLYFHLAAHTLCNLGRSTKRPSLGDFKTSSEGLSDILSPCLVGFLCDNLRAGQVCPTGIPYECSV